MESSHPRANSVSLGPTPNFLISAYLGLFSSSSFNSTYLAAPTAPLDLLAATAVAVTPPATLAAPQLAQDEDDLPPATH